MPVSDAELARELADALRRPVVVRARRRWEYASSVPIECLCVDGCPPLLFKDLGARTGPAPEFVVDPRREIEVYARHLDGLDAPACIAAVGSADRAWLVLEHVDGVPLWQAHGALPWLATARWLARLHARPAPPPAGRLLVRDRTHLARWVERALALAPPGTLDGVGPAALAAVDRLAGLPWSLIHGELYPSNVVVEDGRRVRPVDWEMAGLGPGLLDLAALISGDHHPRLRRAIVVAYAREAGVSATDPRFQAALAAARLLVALQWLGWAPGWAPPVEHAHDWAAEARCLAAETGP